MKRIVVIRGGGLGDFIHTLPALSILRNHCQSAKIDFLGTPRYGILGEKRYYFDKVYDIGSSLFTPLFSEERIFRPKLENIFSPVDLVLCYSPDNHGVLRNNLKFYGVRKILYCPPFPGRGNVLEWLALPVVELGMIDSTEHIPPPFIYLTPQDEKNASALLDGLESRQPIIAVHPGSGSPKKNWPADSWISLCQKLKEKACQVVLILGPAEMNRIELNGLAADLRIVDQELPTVAAILKRSTVYCGHDSGITQLALAVGCPSIALFGPTDPHVWLYRKLDKRRCSVLWNGEEKVTVPVDKVLCCISKMLEEYNFHHAVDIP
ncbi:glycosyltransferase family 9 protein [Candidatus Methylacidiphilum infernorum]|uniref:ADP-heptose:LPS heptosyltransferase n=1 Tax=Methylacidiphilum infernorum (isolate V4) TaxID=481448 RepID=B3DUL8_METI4|nr:glycosyltransferase family 9 protein [Candidatus Methylacidiphilum infernorum]ACD83021.1 ADP-heptose:LPS heptosyltransferase [Methylacidiphilum infernorum V4]